MMSKAAVGRVVWLTLCMNVVPEVVENPGHGEKKKSVIDNESDNCGGRVGDVGDGRAPGRT